MTHPQSRSDHVPGNTTTPNFTALSTRSIVAGSPRNRGFRRVRTQPRQTSTVLALRLDVEAEVFDHVVREELPAHRLDTLARLVLAGGVQVDLDVLADPNIRNFAKA